MLPTFINSGYLVRVSAFRLICSLNMESVNRVVDAGYKALWGQNDSTSSRPLGTETVNKIIDSGKKAIWGEQTPQVAHGEEPISGVQGQGSVTDPYDAGNRDGK